MSSVFKVLQQVLQNFDVVRTTLFLNFDKGHHYIDSEGANFVRKEK